MILTNETPFLELCKIRDEILREMKELAQAHLTHRKKERQQMEVFFLTVSLMITERLRNITIKY